MSSIIKQRINIRLQLHTIYSNFIHNESIAGILLFISAILALVFANFPYFADFLKIWDLNAGISIGTFNFNLTISQWINDALMAIFFFVVGLEIKREMLVGELSNIKQAVLPIFAAVGGMIFPAIIYFSLNASHPEASNGWGIPMATDIAFALGIMSLLGKRAPLGLKVFLTALAIVDDLGAIIVLAIFYPTHALHLDMLGYAAIVVAILIVLNRSRVHNALAYIILGILLWYFVFESGIHATIAGVILAMTIPYKTKINEVGFYVMGKNLIEKFKKAGHSEVEVLANPEQQQIITLLHEKVESVDPLMHRFEHTLHPWVSFFIMPIFALANAGVVISSDFLSWPPDSVMLGIFLGLIIGKPVGIFLLSLISVKLKLAELPANTKWIQVLAMGIVAGIGFTMAIFIDGMAFDNQAITDIGKIAILGTSVVAAVLGYLAILLTTKKPQKIE